MRILAVTYGLPWPLNEGAKIRDYHLLRELAQHADVALLSFCKDDATAPDASELRRFCAHVETYVPERGTGGLAAHWRSGRPLAALPFYFDAFARRIEVMAERHRADTVQIEHTFLAPYVTSIPRSCRKVLSLHNIGERQYAGMARLSLASPGALLKAVLMRGWESEWARRFDHCIAVSAADAAWLRRRAPGLPVSVVENGVDCEALRPLSPARGFGLLFVGVLGYPPNADAVVQFAKRVLPRVRRRFPEAGFVVVGHNPRRDVRALAAKGDIELHESVADVLPFYERARVCVVPLRAGGGTRLKILEAMALGRPVVSTTLGCEGLDVAHGNQLLVADEPEAMAANLARLLTNQALANDICARARTWVEQRHDWRLLGAKLTLLHRNLAQPAIGKTA